MLVGSKGLCSLVIDFDFGSRDWLKQGKMMRDRIWRAIRAMIVDARGALNNSAYLNCQCLLKQRELID